MKKNERAAKRPANAGAMPELAPDPCCVGFFRCFNRQQYFEAHEVLERLWLKCRNENRDYYKGLIQIAGAFVHLQKQFQRPAHRVDGKRLRPAARLFALGMGNLECYRPRHLHLDVESLCQLCARCAEEIIRSDFHINPWNPVRAPQIHLTPPDAA